MSAKFHSLVGSILCLLINNALSSPSLSTLHAFGFPEYSAAGPLAELIQASDGMLYGTTYGGGSVGKGTVFRISTNGAQFLVIKSFGATTNDGRRPFAAVIEGNDGALYGVTEEGGDFGFGAVFRLEKSGTNFSVLKHFTGADGAYPEGRLLKASDGMLYGTTSGGGSGTNDFGVIFRLATNGTGFQVLKELAGTNSPSPAAGLIVGT